MNSSAALARQAGMTDAQWKEAVKFDSYGLGLDYYEYRHGHRRRHRLFTCPGRFGRRVGLFILGHHRLSGYLSLTTVVYQHPGRFAAV